MIADNVKVNGDHTDMFFNIMNLSSIYVIYDQKTGKFTAHAPITTAISYLS
jgi:hypothetical protein